MTAKASKTPVRSSVASRCRQLIIDGLTDIEVWQLIQHEFSLPREKYYYPRWYRMELHRLHRTR